MSILKLPQETAIGLFFENPPTHYKKRSSVAVVTLNLHIIENDATEKRPVEKPTHPQTANGRFLWQFEYGCHP